MKSLHSRLDVLALALVLALGLLRLRWGERGGDRYPGPGRDPLGDADAYSHPGAYGDPCVYIYARTHARAVPGGCPGADCDPQPGGDRYSKAYGNLQAHGEALRKTRHTQRARTGVACICRRV